MDERNRHIIRCEVRRQVFPQDQEDTEHDVMIRLLGAKAQTKGRFRMQVRHAVIDCFRKLYGRSGCNLPKHNDKAAWMDEIEGVPQPLANAKLDMCEWMGLLAPATAAYLVLRARGIPYLVAREASGIKWTDYLDLAGMLGRGHCFN